MSHLRHLCGICYDIAKQYWAAWGFFFWKRSVSPSFLGVFLGFLFCFWLCFGFWLCCFRFVLEDTWLFALTYSPTCGNSQSKTTRFDDRLSLERARHVLKKNLWPDREANLRAPRRTSLPMAGPDTRFGTYKVSEWREGVQPQKTWIQKTIWDPHSSLFSSPTSIVCQGLVQTGWDVHPMSIEKDRFVLADSSLISQKQATVFLTSDLEILKDEKATHLLCFCFIGSLKF